MGVSNIIALQLIRGSNAKKEFIKENKDNDWFKRFLYYALNPMLTYNISENTMKKLLESETSGTQKLILFEEIFECCEFLSRLRGIDDATLRQICCLLKKYPDDERDIYIKLLSKTLRLGVTAKTVNKIIPNLIPEWEVQQSFPIDKYPMPEGSYFWVTEKLNGNRATFYNGLLYSRTGAVYKGLGRIVDSLRWLSDAGFVLDGELILKDKDGLTDNEAFRIATGILNSDDVNKTGICYTIFDIIPVKDFESATPKVEYKHRRRILDDCAKQMCESEYVKVTPVLYEGTDQSVIEMLLSKMVEQDKEGLMINMDVPYQRTRHRGILKVKRFYTMDLPIIRCEEGSGRLEGTLGALVLAYKNNEVKVGSGFTDEQRTTYWENREQLQGTICEVKYKEISKDKKTQLESLQFPVFVRLRDDKDAISYG